MLHSSPHPESDHPVQLLESCVQRLCELHLGRNKWYGIGSGEMSDKRWTQLWQACTTALHETSTRNPLDAEQSNRVKNGDIVKTRTEGVIKDVVDRSISAGYPEVGDRFLHLLDRLEQSVASTEEQGHLLQFLFALRDSVASKFQRRTTFQSGGAPTMLSFKLFEEMPDPDALVYIPKAAVEVLPPAADQGDDLLQTQSQQLPSYNGWLKVPNRLQPQQPRHSSSSSLLRIPLSILAIENSPGSATAFDPLPPSVGGRTAKAKSQRSTSSSLALDVEEVPMETELLVHEQLESLIKDCMCALNGVNSGLLRLRGALSAESALLVGPAALGILRKIQNAAECRFKVEAFIERYKRSIHSSQDTEDIVLQAFAAGVDVVLKGLSIASMETLFNLKIYSLAQLHLLTNTLQLRLRWLASLCWCDSNDLLRGPALLDYLHNRLQKVPPSSTATSTAMNTTSTTSTIFPAPSSSSWWRETLETLFLRAAKPVTAMLSEWAFTVGYNPIESKESSPYTVDPDPQLDALFPPSLRSFHKTPACSSRCISSLYDYALSAGLQLRFLASIDKFEVIQFLNELRLVEAARQEETVDWSWQTGSSGLHWLPVQAPPEGPNSKRQSSTSAKELHRSRLLCLDRLHDSLGIRQIHGSKLHRNASIGSDYAIAGFEEQENSEQSTDIGALVSSSLDVLQLHVRSQCLVVSQACLSFLVAQPAPLLAKHFRMLRLLYFQEAGDWADTLVDNLFALPEQRHIDGFTILEDALRASSLAQFTMPPQSHLNFTIDSGEGSPTALVLEALIEANTTKTSLTKALAHRSLHTSPPSSPPSSSYYAPDRCHLKYTVPWPYKAALPDDLMLCLSAVFTVMLRVRRLTRALYRVRHEWVGKRYKMLSRENKTGHSDSLLRTFLNLSTRFCETVATFFGLCTTSGRGKDALCWETLEKHFNSGQLNSLDQLVEFNRRAVYECMADIMTYCGYETLCDAVETAMDSISSAVSLCSANDSMMQHVELCPELEEMMRAACESVLCACGNARCFRPTGHVALDSLCDCLSRLVI